MKILQKICFVLLLATFLLSCSISSTKSGAYGESSCFEKLYDVDDCRVKAEQGDALAQNNLGGMYYNGQGVVQDDKEAVKWYTKASEQGDALAQNNLGGMYYNGQGVAQDDKEAVKWFRTSAEQGYSGAQNNLGLMYDNGQGVVQDYKESVKWYRKSAEQGFDRAQFNLGLMHFTCFLHVLLLVFGG